MTTPTCHPDRPHYAHLKCRQCYYRDYLNANPEKRTKHVDQMASRRRAQTPRGITASILADLGQ